MYGEIICALSGEWKRESGKNKSGKASGREKYLCNKRGKLRTIVVLSEGEVSSPDEKKSRSLFFFPLLFFFFSFLFLLEGELKSR